jgi:transcriptional regulator with XRE-family HTH domain
MSNAIYIFSMKKKNPGPKKGIKFDELPKTIFGSVLVKLRKQRGLTQAQLAEKMGTTKRAIAYYERSMKNPSIGTIVKIAEALGIQKEKLLKTPNAKNGKEDALPIARSRMLQKAWETATKLPMKDQQYLAKTIQTLAAQNRL